MLRRLSLAFMSVLFLDACTTFSKDECEHMNWNEAGQKVAAEGQNFLQGSDYYNRECAKEHGIKPDTQAMQTGYNDGIKKFCAESNAYGFGERGGKYNGTCPGKDENKFITKYLTGRQAYLEKRVSELESQVSGLESEVSNLRSENSSLQSDAARGQNCNCP